MMRENYLHPETRSIITLHQPGMTHPGWTICRVSVIRKHRGKGFASMLMRDVTADADREGVDLYLEIRPDGSPHTLDFEQLFKFYARNGFRPFGEYPIMRRRVDEVYDIRPWGIDLSRHP